MFATGLQCLGCGQALPLGLHYSCPACGGILRVVYDYESMAGAPELRACLSGPTEETGMWRYRPLLPVRDRANIVTLGEGDTPLLPTARLGRQLGLPRLMLKMEGANPTASFKDRPTSAGIGVARELGAGRVIIASSGNAGAATAAYAARAGLPCLVVVPEGTPHGKVARIPGHGHHGDARAPSCLLLIQAKNCVMLNLIVSTIVHLMWPAEHGDLDSGMNRS
ncbi:MAG: pyridoxal-phosphate dependent enzyme [Bacteroidota bacterium]